MAATLTSLVDVAERLRAEDTPTPPASSDGFAIHDTTSVNMETSSPSTPTRHSFAGVSGQRPLPDQLPHPGLFGSIAVEDPPESADSTQQDLDDDVDMGEADADTVVDEEASDDESLTSESQRPSKKKKGQRFFCTDFPPCQLSFTRSEHLARHIRKHTGERPFQCHCSRRFSRLDNLRQHAQTVHVNEDIPGDSLAATSTRFQRQIRTDRVRPSSSRSRGSTMNGGQTPTTHPRGHSRNLSTSSIGSVTSTFTIPDDNRRQHPALSITTDSLKRSHDMTDGYHHADCQAFYPQSGISTPISQAFSAHLGSPGYNSGFASPSSTISRSSYYSGPRHSRRLSVPSGPNPFQSAAYTPGYHTPVSSRASIYSNDTSGYASPTSSIVSPGRYDSETEVEYRRRTWHPSTQSNYLQRPATSGLSYHQTPDEPTPALSEQMAAKQVTRLPGIESFDLAPPASTRPQADGMMLNSISRPVSSTFDSGIQQGLNRLDIAATSESQWQQTHAPPTQYATYHHHHHNQHISMPEVPVTPRRNKRQAWYGGPVTPTAATLQPLSESLPPSAEVSRSSDREASTAPSFQSHDHLPSITNQHDSYAAQAVTLEHPFRPHPFQAAPPPLTTPQYGYGQDYQHKPDMPQRADSGLGPFAQAGPMTALSQQLPQSQIYHLQAGHDARFANGYIHARPERTVSRLEALVAVATSENRAVEEQH